MKQLNQEQINNLPEWMLVEGFPNYEVNCRKGLVRNTKTLRVLKPSLGNNGYPKVILCEDGKVHTKTVHRTVANAAFSFYNISTEGLFVCHLDEERNDPRIANLALGTNKENMGMPKAKQRNSKSKKGKHLSETHRKKLSEAQKGEKNHMFGKRHSIETKKKLSDAHPKKAVGAYKDGELILTFESIQEAGRNGFNCWHVSSCCNGRLKTYKGYEWRFLDTPTAMTAS
jgi:group I intron endonuclease